MTAADGHDVERLAVAAVDLVGLGHTLLVAEHGVAQRERGLELGLVARLANGESGSGFARPP